uniref:ZBED1_2 protein n=1 Tax=Fopius arisanus TaxID=64838 RepID=A0A0C9RAK5_9HYME
MSGPSSKLTWNSKQGPTLSPQQVEKIDVALANFFFGCNIPFNVVEAQLFKEFVQCLNPTYKPPSRKKLSTKLLDKVYTEINEDLKTADETDGVLVIDGWKNSAANTKNVVCTIHKQDQTSLFLHSWDFSELRETGDKLALVICEASAMAREMFNINIYAVVSDNAAAMVRMGRLVDVWHVTCNSHSGNLLLKSLVSPDFAESLNQLLREFRTSKAERELKKRGGTRIMLVCETRWCTFRDTFRCCLKNLNIMRQLVQEGIVLLKENNRKLLEDSTLAAQLQDAIILFDPVCQLINSCQAADRNIADAVESWLKLNIPTSDDKVADMVNKRLEKVLQPIALTANFLHPVYQGKQFTHLELLKATVDEFLDEEMARRDLQQWEGLREYKEKTGIFKTIFDKQITSPKAFWCLAEGYYPTLSQLAQRLLNIPSSSAQIERLFSNWAFIHSDLRNRLSIDHSRKLVSIYYALKMQDFSEDDKISEKITVKGCSGN